MSDAKLEEGGYRLPITADSVPAAVASSVGSQPDFRKQLALKEQDLAYALKKVETSQAEVRQLEQQLAQLADEKDALLDYIEEVESQSAIFKLKQELRAVKQHHEQELLAMQQLVSDQQ